MAIMVDNQGTDLRTQIELDRLRREEPAPPVVPAAQPSVEPASSTPAPIELPATIDRRPVVSAPAAPASTTEPAAGPEEPKLDGVYTMNGGQTVSVVEGVARATESVTRMALDPTSTPPAPAASTREGRLAGDAGRGAVGAIMSGAFTADRGGDVIDVSASILAQGIDDIAAGATRVQGALGPVASKLAKWGPVAAVSSIVANGNAVIQDLKNPENSRLDTAKSVAKAGVNIGVDLAGLAGAAALGSMGGPVGALAAVAGYSAYQLLAAPAMKEGLTSVANAVTDWVGGWFS